MTKKRKKSQSSEQSDEQSKKQKLDGDNPALDTESNESAKIPQEEIYSNITTLILKHPSRKIKKKRYQFKNIYGLKNLIPELPYVGNRKEEFKEFIQQFTALETDVDHLIKLYHTLRKRLKTKDKNLKKYENSYFHYHFLWLKNTTLAFIHSNLLPFFESLEPQKELDAQTLEQHTTLAPLHLNWLFTSIFRRNFEALRSLLSHYENPDSKNKLDQINLNIPELSPPDVHDTSAEEIAYTDLAENSQNTDFLSTTEIMDAITKFLSKKKPRYIIREDHYEITSLFSLTSLIENNNHKVEDQLISYYAGSDKKGFINFVQQFTVFHTDEHMLGKLQTNLRNRISAPSLQKHEQAYFEYHFLWLRNTTLAFVHSNLLHFFQLSFPQEDLTLGLLEKHTKLNIFDLSRLLIAMFEQTKLQDFKRLRREITKSTADSTNNQNINNIPEKNLSEVELNIEDLSPTTITRIITDTTNINTPDIQPLPEITVLEPYEESVTNRTNLINTPTENQNTPLEMRILYLENHVEAKRENFDRIIKTLSEMHIHITNLENQATELEAIPNIKKRAPTGQSSPSNLHMSTHHDETRQSPPYGRTSSRFFSTSPTNLFSENQSPINQEVFNNTNTTNNTTESRVTYLENAMAKQHCIEKNIEKTLENSMATIFQLHKRIFALQEKNKLQAKSSTTFFPEYSSIISSRVSSPYTNFFLETTLKNDSSDECPFPIVELEPPDLPRVESPRNI